jgi:ribonuclease P/MRP protein subunit POP1
MQHQNHNPILSSSDARQQLAASLITPSIDIDPTHEQHLPTPPEQDLIGFITTGNYNLSEGKGTGIGPILLAKVALSSRGKKKAREARVCIVRAAGERVGRLGFWEIV